MIKHLALLCLLLQFGANASKIQRQVEVQPVVVQKEQVKSDSEPVHVVKKDHPVEEVQKTVEKSVETAVKSETTVVETVKDENIPVQTLEAVSKSVFPDKVPDKTIEEEEEAAKEIKVDAQEPFKEVQEPVEEPSVRQGLVGQGQVCTVNNQVGFCTTNSLQCLSSRGTILGSLGASGACPTLGVCCQVTQTCGQTSSRKSVLFVSPQTFSTSSSTCDFTVNVVDKEVCQIRIDFDSFQIANPRLPPTNTNTGFQCIDDSFTVISPSNEKIPTICGFNTGQHMYIRVNYTNNERSVRLRFNLAARPTTINGVALSNPMWNIRVRQIECPTNKFSLTRSAEAKSLLAKDTRLIAPPGCLQYYLPRTGTVRNFGFNPNVPAASNNYIGKMDYSICFRRSTSTCGMKFSLGSFLMSGDTNNCNLDYVFVPEGVITQTNGNTQNAPLSRICANSMPAGSFIQSVGNFPFYMHVKTDDVSNNGQNEQGFNFNYEVPPTTNCQ